MSTYTQIYYHIVFAAKNRQPVLVAERREELFKYVWGIIKNQKSHLYRINGAGDHLHLLVGLHPTVPLAQLVKDIKVSSSKWIKENRVFPKFEAWQDGYSAFTVGHGDKEGVIEYIKGQEEHHRKLSFNEELKRFLTEAGIEFEEKWLP